MQLYSEFCLERPHAHAVPYETTCLERPDIPTPATKDHMSWNHMLMASEV